jgi:hypothetical protein
MTAVALKLKEPPTDERAALRLAIEASNAAHEALIEHDQAIARADTLLDQRRERLEAIKQDVEAAMLADSEAVAAAIKTGAPMPTGKTREVRAAELAADDDVRGAQAAIATLDAQRERLLAADRAATAGVHRAVNATLLPLILTISARIQDCHREILISGHVLDVLTAEPPGVALTDAWENISSHMHARLFAKDTAPVLEDWPMLRPIRQKFEAARKALHTDPDTRVPDLRTKQRPNNKQTPPSLFAANSCARC